MAARADGRAGRTLVRRRRAARLGDTARIAMRSFLRPLARLGEDLRAMVGDAWRTRGTPRAPDYAGMGAETAGGGGQT